MGILQKWINPIYLNPRYIVDLQEQLKAKPTIKYHVLDNLFLEEQLDKILEVYDFLPFLTYEAYKKSIASIVGKDEDTYKQFAFYPYESNLINMHKALEGWKLEDTGIPFIPTEYQVGLLNEIAELFFSEEWYSFISTLANHEYGLHNTERNMRFKLYSADTQGYWIHTDRFLRNGSINHWGLILYLTKERKAEDGGLFQIWNIEKTLDPTTPIITNTNPEELINQTRVNITGAGPGDSFRDLYGDRIYQNQTRDMTLVDQIVPTFNRMYLCNFDTNIAYHSITPNVGDDRKAIVQLLGTNIGKQYV